MNFGQVLDKLREDNKLCHVYKGMMESDDAYLTEDMKICGGSAAVNGFLIDKSKEESESFPVCAFHMGILKELQSKNPSFFTQNKLSLRFGHEN